MQLFTAFYCVICLRNTNLELNTKANWVEYITQRASDMESMNIRRETWVDSFDDEISMVEGNQLT